MLWRASGACETVATATRRVLSTLALTKARVAFASWPFVADDVTMIEPSRAPKGTAVATVSFWWRTSTGFKPSASMAAWRTLFRSSTT